MMKIAGEANTTITEMKGVILKASIYNWIMNMTHIFGISEDLQNLVQRDMENWVYQIQRCLADKLDDYKDKGNKYMNDNIQEIQELYKNKEQRRESDKKGIVEDEEVILIKPYKISTTTSKTTSSKITELSFIQNEIKNLEKYMKFICSLTQTRLFKPLPYYTLIHSRGEQDPDCQKEIVTAFVQEKYNTEMTRNSYLIILYQGGPPHKPYFVTIDNHERAIIRPNKKLVAIYIVRELEVLV